MLNFIGTGSAFNTELGNNSAFIKKGKSLFLIDAGGMVFHEVMEMGMLEDLEKIYILITHSHPDHIGSLGEFIFYAHFILKIKPVVMYPNRDLITKYFECTGVENDMRDLRCETDIEIVDENLDKISIKYLEVSHADIIPAYGFLMKYNGETIYYSGDSREIGSEVLNMLFSGEIDRMYQDTCGYDYEGNVHLSLAKLEKLIPKEHRHKVYSMHFDKRLNLEEVRQLGFKTVKRFQEKQ